MPTDLPTATLGRTGLDITRLGHGAMEIRGTPRGRDISDDDARRILTAVLDSGITYVEAKRRLDQAGGSPAPAD